MFGIAFIIMVLVFFFYGDQIEKMDTKTVWIIAGIFVFCLIFIGACTGAL